MTNSIYRLSRAVYVLNCKYSVESFRVIMPEFESQRFFFFLAYFFVLRENLNFSCFTRRLFFYLACAQFICKRIYFIRRKANTISMQCRCKRFITKWADNITEPGKGKDFNQGMRAIERMMKRDQRLKRRNLNGLARKGVQLHDFEVR